MSKIKVSSLEDAVLEPINETEVSVISKPKRVRPPRNPVQVVEPTNIEAPPEPQPVQEVPKPVIQPRQTKQPRMTTCNNCGKELLEKTFKYYHQLKCKPKPNIVQAVTPEIKSKETPRYENNTVEFNYRRSTQLRPAKYASLLSKAF